MTTDFVEDHVSVSAPTPESGSETTRWQARPVDLSLEPEPEERERGGIILAALVALLLPLIIAGAVLIPDSSTTDDGSGSNELESIGLDGITVAPDRPSSNSDETDPAGEPEPATEVAAIVETDETEAAVPSDDEAPGSDSDTSAGLGVAPVSDTGATTTGAAPTTGAPAPAPTVRPGATSTPASATPEVGPSSSTAPTTAAPTSVPPTTASPTTAPTPTTTPTVAPTTVVPTTMPPEEPDPTAFSQRVEIGQITDTSVRYRFTAEATSSYVAVIRDDVGIVATSTGTAVGGEDEVKSALGLTPGTDYTIRVRLLGPPEVSSAPVPFRTSGGSPDQAEVDVAIMDLTVVEVESTRFLVNYATNICANGSFVIREVGGSVVGRNSGQDDGCTTRHLAIPGFWTPALKPDTTYILEITVEADGQGRGDGNTASRTLTVTTRA